MTVQACSLTYPACPGSERGLAWRLLVAAVVLSMSVTLLLLKLSYVQNHISTALAERDKGVVV